MKLGAQGDDVAAVQKRLAVYGYLDSAEIGGVFDERTDKAIRAFQRNRNLVVDGDVGPSTNIALLERAYPLRKLLDGRSPQITSRHAIHNRERSNHYGADLFYRFDGTKDAPMRIGDGGRTAKWIIPPGTMACAAAAGVVVNCGPSRTGHRLWIRHEGGEVATGYFHLQNLTAAVKLGATLELGVELGLVGHNPSPEHDAIHLHFELYRGNIAADVKAGLYPRGTMDPERFLAGATYLATR